MTMFGSQWLANAGSGYEISQSIRFNDDDSAYLTRTPGSDGNLKTWTYSVWCKRGAVGSGAFSVMGAGADNTNDMMFYFGPANEAGSLDIIFRESSTIDGRITSYSGLKSGGRLFRDPSAWMHFVLVWDTTNSTSADRLRLYINGERATTDAFAITEPSLNDESRWNTARANLIGRVRDDASNYFDGYMADINFIDGTALTAASFGETNDEGVWIPKAYSGAYGTNGFYLKGQDSSALGDDTSGNGNDFTSSGLAAADQMLDTPTDNYCVLSPIDKNSNVTLSDGNLVAAAGGGWYHGRGTLFAPSGKWYYEWIPTAGSYAEAGWMLNVSGNDYAEEESDVATTFYRGVGAAGHGFVIGSGSTDSSVTNFSLNDVIMMAIDVDTMKMWVGINGTWYNSGDPAGGTSPVGTWTDAVGQSVAPWYGLYTSTSETFNFGQRPFAYTIPTGFNSWNTANLPTPSITDGSAYFQPVLYTGTTGAQDITFSGNSDLAPDWLWFKARIASNHFLFDKVRGVLKTISSDDANAEVTSTGSMTAFGTDGFSLGDGGSDNDINGVSGNTYVAWGWAAGNSAGSSNTDGSVTSTVSHNSTSNFSVVKYAGTGSGSSTVGHGLGVTPDMIIMKHLDRGQNWRVFHTSVGVGKTSFLNSTAAAAADPDRITAVSSTTFTAAANMNESADYIAYAFAEVEGYSSFGSYTGNGSTDGPFVYTNFKPAVVMTKRTSGASDWKMWDNERGPYNVNGVTLAANTSGAESTGTAQESDFLSNGFKIRGSDTETNGSGSTYLYMAFAENPFGGDDVAPATAR